MLNHLFFNIYVYHHILLTYVSRCQTFVSLKIISIRLLLKTWANFCLPQRLILYPRWWSVKERRNAPKKTTKNLNNISLILSSIPIFSKTNWCCYSNCIIYILALLLKLLLSKGLEVKLISQTPHSRNVCSRLDLIKMQVNSFGHNLVAFEIVLAWMVGGVLISFMFTYGKSSRKKKIQPKCVYCLRQDVRQHIFVKYLC